MIQWEYRLSDSYYHIQDYKNALQYALKSEELLDPGNLRLKRNLNLILAEIYDVLERENLAYKHLKIYTDLIKESKDEDVASLVMRAEVRSVLDKKRKGNRFARTGTTIEGTRKSSTTLMDHKYCRGSFYLPYL